jgi:hypothetical protein
MRRKLAAVLAAAALAVTAACTAEDDVATLDGDKTPAASNDAVAAQAKSADEFAGCLEALGVPVETDDPYEDGQRDVWLAVEGDYLMGWVGGMSGMGGDPPFWMKEMAAKYDPYLAEDLGGAPAEAVGEQPKIGFDAPGQDGDYRPGRETEAPVDPHVRALQDVLLEKWSEFEEAHPDPYCC